MFNISVVAHSVLYALIFVLFYELNIYSLQMLLNQTFSLMSNSGFPNTIVHPILMPMRVTNIYEYLYTYLQQYNTTLVTTYNVQLNRFDGEYT